MPEVTISGLPPAGDRPASGTRTQQGSCCPWRSLSHKHFAEGVGSAFPIMRFHPACISAVSRGNCKVFVGELYSLWGAVEPEVEVCPTEGASPPGASMRLPLQSHVTFRPLLGPGFQHLSFQQNSQVIPKGQLALPPLPAGAQPPAPWRRTGAPARSALIEQRRKAVGTLAYSVSIPTQKAPSHSLHI